MIDNQHIDNTFKTALQFDIIDAVDDYLEAQISAPVWKTCENSFGRLLIRETSGMMHQMEYDIFAEKRNGRKNSN